MSYFMSIVSVVGKSDEGFGLTTVASVAIRAIHTSHNSGADTNYLSISEIYKFLSVSRLAQVFPQYNFKLKVLKFATT